MVRRAISRGFSNTLTSMTPATNPPMCAQTATPLDTSGLTAISSGKPEMTCHANHIINTSHAGIAITFQNTIKTKSMLIRIFG